MRTEMTAGSLLVATPEMTDPNFARTVIFMIEHGEGGSAGVVLNRPSVVPVRSALPDWEPCVAEPGVLFGGGPVDDTAILGLARVADPDLVDPDGVNHVGDDIVSVDLSRPELQAGVADLRVFQGYAGWGPGQLASELAVGAWFVFAAGPEDAFCDTPELLVDTVFARQGGTLAAFARYPSNPRLN